MRLKYYIFLITIFFSLKGICQNYTTKTGFIGFYSKTPWKISGAKTTRYMLFWILPVITWPSPHY